MAGVGPGRPVLVTIDSACVLECNAKSGRLVGFGKGGMRSPQAGLGIVWDGCVKVGGGVGVCGGSWFMMIWGHVLLCY